jgi:hypothetical protein
MPRPPRATLSDMKRWSVVVLLAVLVSATLAGADVVAPGAPAPELAKGAWINSDPLTMQSLRGRVVLVDFWTYG